jgi:hypothetical protein
MPPPLENIPISGDAIAKHRIVVCLLSVLLQPAERRSHTLASGDHVIFAFKPDRREVDMRDRS